MNKSMSEMRDPDLSMTQVVNPLKPFASTSTHCAGSMYSDALPSTEVGNISSPTQGFRVISTQNFEMLVKKHKEI
jgi:hypothetical protein